MSNYNNVSPNEHLTMEHPIATVLKFHVHLHLNLG